MLLLERQVLKKRVKRDFLELQAGSEGEQWRQPVARLQQAAQQRLGQSAQTQQQLLRPANQVPQRPAHHQFTRPANQAPGASRGPAQRPYPMSADLGLARTFDALESSATSSALLYQQLRRPPQPQQQAGNVSQQQVFANQSGSSNSRPFNDPGWASMWYLVS